MKILKKIVPLVVALALGLAAGWLVRGRYPATVLARPDGIPETVEVYRAARGDLSPVADTIRVLGYTDAGGAVEVEVEPAGANARRPAWVVRLRFGSRVLTLRGVALNHPPG